MDKESMSTELRIYFEFAEKRERPPANEDVEFVKSVLEDHGLSYDYYDMYNISTEFFVDSESNMNEVDEIESKIDNHFDDFEISRHIVDKDIYGSEPGTYQSWINISTPESPTGSDADGDNNSDWREFKE